MSYLTGVKYGHSLYLLCILSSSLISPFSTALASAAGISMPLDVLSELVPGGINYFRMKIKTKYT